MDKGRARAVRQAAPPRAGPASRFHPEAPSIHPERILRIQGYSDLTRVRPVIRRAAEEMAAVAACSSEPVVAYRHVAVTSLRDEVLELEGGARLHCKAFDRQLAGCTGIVAFVLTVGEGIPARVVELAERGDLLEGLLLETAGWLAIEDATRQFKVWLREDSLARKRRITSRMGPGYSYKIGNRMHDWPLEESRVLVGLLGEADSLPVKLMSSCAMMPKMSRSGIYGIAPLPTESRRAPSGHDATEST